MAARIMDVPEKTVRREPQEGTDLAESRRWAREADLAVEKEDWARAVVCYRKALGHAPFNGELRVAFEDALEGQILASMERRGVAHLVDIGDDVADARPARPAAREAAPRPAAPRRSGPPRVARRLSGLPRPGRRMVVAAASIALVVAVSGLLGAAFASGLVRSVFERGSLPNLASAVALPAELDEVLGAAQERLMAGERARAVELLRPLAAQFSEYRESHVHPALARSLRLMALDEAREDRHEKAARLFAEATQFDPTNVDNWLDLGSAWRNHALTSGVSRDAARKRTVLADAEKAYQQALTHAPGNSIALYNIGQVKAAQNERRQAIENFERVVALAPDSLEASMARRQLAQLKK